MLLNYWKVCDVCRSTGLAKGPPLPPSYPIEFLNRIGIPSNVIEGLPGQSRNEDVYLHLGHHPEAEPRAVALTTRAAMLFIILFFVLNVLPRDTRAMRSISPSDSPSA